MAEIGKDGQNLFESIFHPLKEKNDPLTTADCSNINNGGQNVNKQMKHVDEVGLPSSNHKEMDVINSESKEGLAEEETDKLKATCASNSESGLCLEDVSVTVNSVADEAEHRETLLPDGTNFHGESNSYLENKSENGIPTPSNADSATCNTRSCDGTSNEKVKSLKRGIHFPPDTCISGYHEPPDPWKDAQSCTSEEIVAAYKKSCEIHGTKPSSKVIQQLQAIQPAHGKREDSFMLKGERLDQKQCEAIEEIFRRVQFKFLDLEACHLDDECVQAIFEMIEYYESACQLNISFNKNISVRGWQACSRLVRRTPCLTYLDMRSCDLDDRTIPLFGRALKLGCHLTILHMENMNLSGKTLIILVAALKMNETLQELFLAENKLMPLDGVHLGQLVRYNHKLGLLDLRNNHLQDVGTNHICEGLLEQGDGQGLRTLVLWNNHINYQAMPGLGRALAHSDTLETLNIGHNPITNEGAHLLKDGLLKTTSLLRLGLQGTRISDEGAVALAEYIADSTILLRVDLRDNDIKTGGLMALSHAMRVNTSVTRIDLDKDAKKESYIKDYAEQQGRLLRDILTFQQRNVESALQREEEVRAELERKAQDAAQEQEAIKEVQTDGQEVSAVPSATEAFTIIEKSEAVDQASVIETAGASNGEGSVPSRPNQLFNDSTPPRLHAQESLDSPMPASKDEKKSLEDNAKSKPKLSVPPLEAPPAEMILSPQYVPRTMARKIFSVSRVNENEPRLSVSPIESPVASAPWDPLNASTIPVPTSFTLSASSSCHPPISSSSSDVSPSTALAQSLVQDPVSDLPLQDADSDISQVPSDSLLCPQSNRESGKGIKDSSESVIDKDTVASTVDTTLAELTNVAEEVETVNETGKHEKVATLEELISVGMSTSTGTETLNSDCLNTHHQHRVPNDGNSNSSNGLQATQSESNDQPGNNSSLPFISSGTVDYLESQTLHETTLVSQSIPLQSSGDETKPLEEDDGPVVPSEASTDLPPNSDPTTSASAAILPTPCPKLSTPADSMMDSFCPDSCDEVEEEEDSWLAVSKDEAAETKEYHPPSQPDFFTTLSMNGLTQELASALTSLDISELPSSMLGDEGPSF